MLDYHQIWGIRGAIYVVETLLPLGLASVCCNTSFNCLKHVCYQLIKPLLIQPLLLLLHSLQPPCFIMGSFVVICPSPMELCFQAILYILNKIGIW